MLAAPPAKIEVTSSPTKSTSVRGQKYKSVLKIKLRCSYNEMTSSTLIGFAIDYITTRKKQGPTEIRTRIVGFKVQSDSHYTIGPLYASRF